VSLTYQKREGYTIVEVLIASAIAVIVFLGLLAALLYARKYNLMKSYNYEAVRILHQKLEEVSNLDYSDVTDALNNGATSCEDALTSGKNTVTRYLGSREAKFGLFYKIEEDATLGLKKVFLDVCWKYRGKLHKVSGSTIIRNTK
jgi:type II secretory pathway pseudopilin PulG